MATATIDPQLRQAMQARRNEEFNLLLRVERIDPGREQVLVARAVTIRRSLTLAPTYAVTCTGATGLGLLDIAWIQRVEEDRAVYAL